MSTCIGMRFELFGGIARTHRIDMHATPGKGTVAAARALDLTAHLVLIPAAQTQPYSQTIVLTRSNWHTQSMIYHRCTLAPMYDKHEHVLRRRQ
jgi:hypothetical protein